MARNNDKLKPATAYFKIMLDVSMELGHMTLDQALEKAKAMDVTDVVDLSGLSHNDSAIKVTGVHLDDDIR